ncbi:protein NUD1, partial [Phenoliferia sp. Uapishka_3]
MAALWASPSMRSPSPTSSHSPDDGSPQLPALSSPFNMSSIWDGDDNATDTPTKAVSSTSSSATPAWMTDELEEEWIEQDDSGEAQGEDDGDESGGSLIEKQEQGGRHSSISPINSTYASLNKPRVPSSLRYAFAAASSTSSTITPLDQSQSQSPSSPSSQTGSFVIRDSSIIIASGSNAAGGESQLQAAVRALKGPSAGLGAPVGEVEDGEVVLPGNKTAGVDRLGGLRRLFDPPSPPKSLPRSSHPAPSAPTFNFSPPLVPRTSWKSIPHFSPNDSSSTTPLARNLTNAPSTETIPSYDSEETPTRKSTTSTAPVSKPTDRYLRSTALDASLTSQRLQSNETANIPATPAPQNQQQEITATPASQLRLFEFQYDTFTRNHLAALVDEIDELGSGDQSRLGLGVGGREEEDVAWETSFVEVPQALEDRKGKAVEEQQEEGDESDEAGVGRSSKRIRLSPQENSMRRRGRYLISNTNADEGAGRYTPGRTSMEGRGGRSGLSASRRRPTRQSTPIDIWKMSTSHPSPSHSATPSSLYFAHSLDQSSKKVASTTRGNSEASPAAAPPISTRDRLGAANALLDRIRARTTEKEKAKAQFSLDEDPDPSTTQSTNHLRPPRSPTRIPTISPRKILRRISASDEVDAELSSSIFHSSSATVNDDAPLPRFAAAASASLRNALEQSSRDGYSTTSANSLGSRVSVDTPPSGRRHFARTPVSAARRGNGNRRRESMVDNIESAMEELQEEKAVVLEEREDLNTRRGPSHVLQHVRHRSLTTIGPGDVEALLAKSATPSRMVFDQAESRWIKLAKTKPASSRFGQVVEEMDESTSTEDDPFRDFETTKASDVSKIEEDGMRGLGIFNGTPPGSRRVMAVSPKDKNHFEPAGEVERLVEMEKEELDGAEGWQGGKRDLRSGSEEETEEEEEEEEGELEEEQNATDTAGFGREESPFHIFQALQRDQEEEEPPSETEEITEAHQVDEGNEPTILPPDIGVPLEIKITDLPPTPAISLLPPISPILQVPLLAPAPSTPQPLSGTVTRPRSALKSAVRTQSDPGFLTPDSRAKATLTPSKVPRSVSFSDGKTSGKIEGLEMEKREIGSAGSRLRFEVEREGSEDGERSTSFLGPMGGLVLDEEENGTQVIGSPESLGEESERMKGIERALKELEGDGEDDKSVVVSSFEGAPKVRAKSTSPNQSRTFRRTTAPDATFLTECSFGVSRDRLVQYITDAEPFTPNWEGLRSINLARKGAESLVRLKDFLPNLDEADLSENEISFLTGVPSTVRTLLLPHNRISSLTSFGHLRNLERIDMSNNHIDSVGQLSCLVHLRELKADNNKIKDLGGLADIDGLVRLSLKGNCIESVDFSATNWTRLEMLNLSRNKITDLRNIERMQNLSLLNLDYNNLSSLEPTGSMPRLRVLRLCSNNLETLDISFAPKLRTLFVDSSRLGAIDGTDRLRKLENLSVRDQGGAALSLPMHEVRDVKRLYLSGNPLPPSFPSAKFFNLVYLELAMCGITSLPTDLAALVPNVRVLNLNFNFIDDLRPLAGLSRLRKLTILGARLHKCRPVAEVLQTMVELESVDLRTNPLTLPFYAPLVLQQGDDLPPHSDYRIIHPDDDAGEDSNGVPRSRQWSAIDHKFRKSLPDTYYLRRKTYRAIILETCPGVMELDGIECSKERRRLDKAVSGLAGRILTMTTSWIVARALFAKLLGPSLPLFQSPGALGAAFPPTPFVSMRLPAAAILLLPAGLALALPQQSPAQRVFDAVDSASSLDATISNWDGDGAGVGHFSEWSRESKVAFLADLAANRAKDWVVVMGNEGGVDHNVPRTMWGNITILGILDHHEDRHLAPDASPRVIAKSASCSSLVAEAILDYYDLHKPEASFHGPLPAELIELLMRTIALDSGGLKKKESLPVDVRSAERLWKRSGWRDRDLKDVMDELEDDMKKAKKSLDGLSLRDLLRRDWKGDAVPTKSKNYPTLSLGFASMPVSMDAQILRLPEQTTPEWFAVERAWTAESGTDVSCVLTHYRDETDRKVKEIAIVVAHGWGKRLSEASADALFLALTQAIEEAPELADSSLEKWERPDGKQLLPRRAVWRHYSESAGRKVIRPIVERAAREWGA